MRTYAVKEVFWTLQGEGLNAGRAAVFVRLQGCNLWSGHPEDRERDAARHQAPCPLWCDTDFVGGERMPAADIVTACRTAADLERPGLVVVTGGEPFLQLDDELLAALRALGEVAVETNGTVAPRWTHPGPDHLTCSPKDPEHLVLAQVHELRVPFPDVDPLHPALARITAVHRYVSPVARGEGIAARDVSRRAAEFCMLHPEWRLSLQTHKLTGLR